MKCFQVFFFCICFCPFLLQGQNKIIEMGGALGISIPATVQRNPDLDRPSIGVLAGVHADFVYPLRTWFYSIGGQAKVFYFSNSPLRDNKASAVKLFGFSFGMPIQLHKLFREEEQFSFRVSAGLIPLLETSALVRTDVPDGGLRFNVAPMATFGILLNKTSSIGFRWFMPVRVYGSVADGDTYHLHNFSFYSVYCLKGKDFRK